MRFWLHEKTARGQASDCKKILFYFFVYLTGSGSHVSGAYLCILSTFSLILERIERPDIPCDLRQWL